MISVVSLPSNIFQNASSSQQQGEDEASESSLSAQPSNESGTIQCITTPCEFPSPKPMPPEPDIDNTRVISSNESKSDKAMQNNNSQSEPCISPCPSGQICIQMCKPIGQPDTSITESESPSELQQETNSISESDSIQSDTMTAERQSDLKTTNNYDTKSSSGTADSLSSE